MSKAKPPAILFKYLPAQRIDFFEQPCLRFTPIEELNDPFETQLALMRESGGQQGLLHEAMKIAQSLLMPLFDSFLHTGILSLSSTNSSLLMWAHYTNNHTGFVLGLDATDSFFESVDVVKYSESRLFFDEIGQSRKHGASLIYRNMFYKSIDWAYESEWRIFKGLIHKFPIIKPNISGLLECPPHLVKSIYLGLRVSEELKKEAQNFCSNHPGIELYQSRLHHSKYLLEFLPLLS